MKEETQTKAEVQVPATTYIPNVPDATTGAFSLGSIAMAVLWGIQRYRRTTSRDSTEMVKDRLEGDLLKGMMTDREGILKERDSARLSEKEAWAAANAAAVENARLKAENAFQQREIERLMRAMEDLQEQFDEIKLRLQQLSQGATGHSGFQPP